jgi:hypothetical protein
METPCYPKHLTKTTDSTIKGSGQFSLIRVRHFKFKRNSAPPSAANEWGIGAICPLAYPCLYATVVTPKEDGQPHTESFDVTDIKTVG